MPAGREPSSYGCSVSGERAVGVLGVLVLTRERERANVARRGSSLARAYVSRVNERLVMATSDVCVCVLHNVVQT